MIRAPVPGPNRGLLVRPAEVGLLLIAIAFTILGCATPPITMDTPPGFAAFTNDTVDVRAISPEGVLVRARTVPNDPEQSLEFWAEVLQRQLSDSGYVSLGATAHFQLAAGEGALFEWLAPVENEDWIYLTAIAVIGTDIAIVEAAGPADEYEAYRGALVESLSSLHVKQPEP